MKLYSRSGIKNGSWDVEVGSGHLRKRGSFEQRLGGGRVWAGLGVLGFRDQRPGSSPSLHLSMGEQVQRRKVICPNPHTWLKASDKFQSSS